MYKLPLFPTYSAANATVWPSFCTLITASSNLNAFRGYRGILVRSADAVASMFARGVAVPFFRPRISLVPLPPVTPGYLHGTPATTSCPPRPMFRRQIAQMTRQVRDHSPHGEEG